MTGGASASLRPATGQRGLEEGPPSQHLVHCRGWPWLWASPASVPSPRQAPPWLLQTRRPLAEAQVHCCPAAPTASPAKGLVRARSGQAAASLSVACLCPWQEAGPVGTHCRGRTRLAPERDPQDNAAHFLAREGLLVRVLRGWPSLPLPRGWGCCRGSLVPPPFPLLILRHLVGQDWLSWSPRGLPGEASPLPPSWQPQLKASSILWVIVPVKQIPSPLPAGRRACESLWEPVGACGSQAAWKVFKVTGVTPRSHPEGAFPFLG